MNIMDRYIGQGMGKYIEKEIFSATKSLLISSPSISISFGKRLFKMAEDGVEIKVITSDKTGTEGDKTNLLAQNFIKPTIPLDYKVVSTKETPMIHVKLYVVDGKTAIIGSPNLGENHFWKYAEYIWVLREPELVKTTMKDYETRWSSYNDSKMELSNTKRKSKNIIRGIRRKM